ncbi:MAG: aryl-sulfate sulfotransferase [Thermoplasmatales archaeon]|nr:MAG: aryl-sulfate sulfotransferase [Thermoplasmatales archaeon]
MKKMLLVLLVGILVLNGSGKSVVTNLDTTFLLVPTNSDPINSTTLIADFIIGQIIEVDINGTIVWEYNEASTPIDVERLNNGNTLIVESYGQERVFEIDNDGNVIWEYKGEVFPFHPADAERLENGNTLITFGRLNQRGIIEVDINGTIIWEYDCTGLFYTGDLERLENGNTLMIISITDNDTRLIEVDDNSTVVWEYRGLDFPVDAERLENGNTLIANHDGLVIEIDIDNKIVWDYNGTNSIIDVERLLNGNTLIVDSRDSRVIEVDIDGNIVWEYFMLNEPADVERIINQPPNAPNIDGPLRGRPDIDYDYTFVATDPDGDDIWYHICWGDKEIIYIYGPYPSGEELTLSYNWTDEGAYTITCWARDIFDGMSSASTLEITIPRTRASSYLLFEWLLERFSLLERLLNLLR